MPALKLVAATPWRNLHADCCEEQSELYVEVHHKLLKKCSLLPDDRAVLHGCIIS